MGSLENNYFSIGFNDFRYLLKYDKNDELSYNRVASESQQVIEKILKGLIENCDRIPITDKERLLKTHNLRKLGETVNFQYHAGLNLSDLAYVKDFYYEARYPGDEFVEVDKFTRDKCIDIVCSTLRKVIPFCPETSAETRILLEQPL